jgi:hypothetical protein
MQSSPQGSATPCRAGRSAIAQSHEVSGLAPIIGTIPMVPIIFQILQNEIQVNSVEGEQSGRGAPVSVGQGPEPARYDSQRHSTDCSSKWQRATVPELI